MILKFAPRNWVLRRGGDEKGPGEVPMVGACEHDNELLDSIRTEVLYQLSDW
jgi:hypothetical protein